MELPLASILVVNYNGKEYLDRSLSSIEKLNYPKDKIEILLIDNGSDDNSENDAISNHPETHLIRNPVNGYASALNSGISRARGKYIAFVNNDAFVDRMWLSSLIRAMESDNKVGCAGGKTMFENGRIHSVGYRQLPDYYWENEGYNQDDMGQYDASREVSGLCWASVLFRRECLQDIGFLDEEYVLYCEDIDASLQCRKRGWKMLYVPDAVAQHVHHDSGDRVKLAEYFRDRGRLIYVAKYHPEKLSSVVQTTRFIQRGELKLLYEILPILIKKVIETHSYDVAEKTLNQMTECLIPIFGALAVDNLMARMQVILGYRTMSIGLYDHALDVIGGGQKYGCTIASVLQERFDVTIIANSPVEIEKLERWYHLPLSSCRLKVIPLPFFDKSGFLINPNIVNEDTHNPFDAIALHSRDYDVFINANMLPMVRPLSPFSIFICHFPDTPRRCYFWAHEYSHLIVNSRYGARWVKHLWDLDPNDILYPPIDMESTDEQEKESMILSVARFETGGSKKQLELVKAFDSLWQSHPESLRNWRLVLAGGSIPRNAYLKKVRKAARNSRAEIEVLANASYRELQDLYSRAKVFWHACGLNEDDPSFVEHFGMTTVEAMQNKCVPVVIDGGGQREIVEHGDSGFRFQTLAELCKYTMKLLESPDLMKRMSAEAYRRAESFSRRRFEEKVEGFFESLEKEYLTIPVPNPQTVLQSRSLSGPIFSPAMSLD